MASTPPIQVEDQTDVEFFDKLVDDDYGTRESRSNPDDLARALSMLSLPDEETSGSASDDLTDTLLEPSEISEDVAVALFHPEAVSEELCCDVKKRTSRSVDGILANTQTDSEPKSTFNDHSSANISSYSGLGKNLYPGWKYDTNTGQWHQIDGYDADRNVRLDNFDVAGQKSHEEGEVNIQDTFDLPISERSDSLYHIQASNVALETIAEDNSVSYSWNQHKWRQSHNHCKCIVWVNTRDNFSSYDNFQQYGKSALQEHGSQPAIGFGQQNVRLEQSSQGHWNGSGGGYDPWNTSQEQPSQACGNSTGACYAQKRCGSLKCFLKMKMLQNSITILINLKGQSHLEQLSNNNYGTEPSVNSTWQSVQGLNPSFLQFDNSTRDGRSSAGRPPHALVAFGFGGKIIVTKETISTNSSFVSGSQGTLGGVISVHSLADVVKTKTDSLNILSGGGFGYFHSLCQQSFPGPLVGGNAASKDVNRWIDEMIANCESSSFDVQTGELMRLLFSLLKILCQHYGKLRSPYGVNSSLELGGQLE
ncbi:hypothetical protein HPP92_005369 [Vanilla planifolia]|uniref:Sec16 central conserved domain-containing protein n=1 Tax=Vanilla planifolia TaxID=51239 RepID=A0A835RNE0_VANPL|nr:hypothetical protein HPP92_005369 [Vanilla planifolia]